VLDFLRLDANIRLDAILPAGTAIKIPDPGLAPMLAVHFAARTLAEASLEDERARLVRLLLPAAARNATALDTVLGYLFIGTAPEDPAILADLAGSTGPVKLANVPVPVGQVGPDAVMPA
jgi:hypothetical protein